MTQDRQQQTPAGIAAIQRILIELKDAETKHPGWPEDKIYAVAILVEEAGEAIQAAIDLEWLHKGTDLKDREKALEHLRKELAQTGAMALRALIHLED